MKNMGLKQSRMSIEELALCQLFVSEETIGFQIAEFSSQAARNQLFHVG